MGSHPPRCPGYTEYTAEWMNAAGSFAATQGTMSECRDWSPCNYPAVQSQNAITAYFSSKQLPHFHFADNYRPWRQAVCVFVVIRNVDII